MSKSQARRQAVQKQSRLHQFIQDQVSKAKPFEGRVYDTLKEMVLEAYKGGTDLPGIKTIAERVETSDTTVSKALRRLVSKGSVVKVGDGIHTRFIPKIPEFFEEE